MVLVEVIRAVMVVGLLQVLVLIFYMDVDKEDHLL
jgi:hypothetical protein